MKCFRRKSDLKSIPIEGVLFLAALVCSVAFSACTKRPGMPDNWLGQLQAHRAAADSFMRYNPDSPFRRDSSIVFKGLHWFPPDPEMRFQSTFHKFAEKVPVIVFGTKGDVRKAIRYGYFEFLYRRKLFRIVVYKYSPEELEMRGEDLKDYLLVWFTDLTTGRETYNIGRYLEVDRESPDSSHVYALDFNEAFNPYCAYSSLYSCAIPTRENFLPLAIRAGEEKYHD